MVENNTQSSLIDQQDPWEVFGSWLDKFSLSPNHIFAIREVSRNLALLHANHPLGQGRKNYSFVVAAIANDWEAQLLLAIHGYPAQALALVRGTYEKLAWLKLFLDDPDRAEVEYERSVKADRPLFGRRLIAEAFGEKFFHDVVAPLNKATHPDLMRLSIFHVDVGKGTPGNPRYKVGPNFDFQYSHAMHLVLQAGATWALSCLESLSPPEDRGVLLYKHIVEVINSLKSSGLPFSTQTDEQIQRLNARYTNEQNAI
jgi:hypothetical protein